MENLKPQFNPGQPLSASTRATPSTPVATPLIDNVQFDEMKAEIQDLNEKLDTIKSKLYSCKPVATPLVDNAQYDEMKFKISRKTWMLSKATYTPWSLCTPAATPLVDNEGVSPKLQLLQNFSAR